MSLSRIFALAYYLQVRADPSRVEHFILSDLKGMPPALAQS